jgi:hypothetical protein
MVIFVLAKMGYLGILVFMMFESACIPIPSEAILTCNTPQLTIVESTVYLSSCSLAL